MHCVKEYTFTSPRLGFRNWIDADIPQMIEVSADPEVMEYFTATATPDETRSFIEKMQSMYSERRHCYFAVDRLEDNQFIGFIGLCYQTYESSFTPGVDIGWRLHKHYWGQGYATEGARANLEYAFHTLYLKSVFATTVEQNLPSINVMKKIGMTKKLEFVHPKLIDHKRFLKCFCYEIFSDQNDSQKLNPSKMPTGL